MDQDHIKNLHDKEAVDKIKELARDVNTCMFCTRVTEMPFRARPMATIDVDDEGNLWFFSNVNSNKNNEIKSDDTVQVTYSKMSDNHYMSITGKAEISQDKNKIEELWNTFIKAWFQGGKDDPDISLIKVVPVDAYYWDTKHGKMISLLKIAASVVTGKTMDDSIEGKISV